MPTPKPVEPNWLTAVKAGQSKKGEDFVVLDLRDVTSFTDYFIICTGSSSRQNQAICDEIHLQLKEQHNELPTTVEGYDNAEWVLQDYGDFIVHIFLDRTRAYYDLERLWRDAKKVALPAEAA